MQEYIEFAGRHTMLFIALAAVVALIIMSELKRATKGFKEVPPSEAVRLINKEDALVLDVREANELGQGSIIDAKHVALSVLPEKLDNLANNKDQPILVFCKMGNRSAQACKLLLKNSYTNVFGLKGGITAWVNDQLPITKK
ncbi:MAG: rhodanese-like domain-containing protein [Gammaproteobacteria bacterium]|nr:MAG: rhodanese-like domain-containing protein [Gammaproteobacteria bacterium]